MAMKSSRMGMVAAMGEGVDVAGGRSRSRALSQGGEELGESLE